MLAIGKYHKIIIRTDQGLQKIYQRVEATPIKYFNLDDQPPRYSMDNKMKHQPTAYIVVDQNKNKKAPTSSYFFPIKWNLLSQIANKMGPPLQN